MRHGHAPGAASHGCGRSLPLPLRAIHVLVRAGVAPVRLPAMTDWELRAIKDLGPRMFAQMRVVYPGADEAVAPAFDERKAS